MRKTYIIGICLLIVSMLLVTAYDVWKENTEAGDKYYLNESGNVTEIQEQQFFNYRIKDYKNYIDELVEKGITQKKRIDEMNITINLLKEQGQITRQEMCSKTNIAFSWC